MLVSGICGFSETKFGVLFACYIQGIRLTTASQTLQNTARLLTYVLYPAQLFCTNPKA